MERTLRNGKYVLMLCVAILFSVSAYTQTATPPSAGDGTAGNPYQIATLDNLYWFSQTSAEWGKHYVQTADIDARTTKNWDSGAGFTPVGSSYDAGFTGTYNGKGHTIDSLYINRPSANFNGLFGYLFSAKVDSLGITNANIKGNAFSGILSGYSYNSYISSCFTTGSVEGNNKDTGGLIGYLIYGSVSNCYSRANVNSSNWELGGFAGIEINSSISNCYSTGSVNGSYFYNGGFLGYKDKGSVTDCFWDTETSGRTTSAGGTGLTTAEMKNIENYINAGWDFTGETTNGTNDIWGINCSENGGYPFLTWQGFTHHTDTEAPVPDVTTLADITGQCSVTVSNSPTATDNCIGTITGTTSDPLTYDSQGTYTITWTYDDGSGNTTTQGQTVIVNDDTNPSISCINNQNIEIPSGQTVYIVTGTEFDPALTDDNCGVAGIENDYNNGATLDGASFPPGITTVTWTVTDNAGNTSQCSFTVDVSIPDGIYDLEEMGIYIYPNPVNEILNITCNKFIVNRLTVSDLLGKRMIDKTVTGKTEHIDMSILKEGIYIVTVTTPDGSFVIKIVKE